MNSGKSWSRRQILQSGAGAMLSAGLWPGTLRATDAASGEFRFIALNDLHCEDQACGEWLQSRVVRQIKATKEPIDFCLVLGDLVEKGTPAELTLVRDVLKEIGLPAHVVPGNHDYATDNERKSYDECFPHSLNYRFDHKGWQFIALDTTHGTQYDNISVQPGTLQWIDGQTPKMSKSKPTIAFTHFPLGEKVRYRPKNAEDVLERFVDHNLKLVLSGHFHGQTERQSRYTTLTTSPCCALKRKNHDNTPQKGYHVYHVKDGSIKRQFVEVSTVQER